MVYILYLNGPSSAGKTTLALALQEAIADPYLHIGIDKMIGFMPEKLNNWTGGFAPEGFSWQAAVDPTGHPIYQIHAGPFALKLSTTLKRMARFLANEGYNLIIDDVAFFPHDIQEWKEALKDFTVLYIGVTTPLDILERREEQRGDRFIGSARGQYFSVHANVSYDLEIDTHAHSLEENVRRIRDAISQQKHR